MATLIDNTSGEWTANEVYEIQQTDKVEGAASGASFGGIGVSNQPHQQLANRTAFLNQQRVTDEANIATLQGQVNILINDHGMQVFTSSGTFAVPANVTRLTRVRVCGGGGGGGGAGGQSAAGGGGAGGYAEGPVSVTPGENVTVTVGAGGGGGNQGYYGGAGGTSSFGSAMSATGGTGGTGTNSGGAGVQQPGGTGSGGTLNVRGGNGYTGFLVSTSPSSFGIGGAGGASVFGGGGSPSSGQPSGGLPYGSGGAGGGPTWNGASGAAGVVIVEW